MLSCDWYDLLTIDSFDNPILPTSTQEPVVTYQASSPSEEKEAPFQFDLAALLADPAAQSSSGTTVSSDKQQPPITPTPRGLLSTALHKDEPWLNFPAQPRKRKSAKGDWYINTNLHSLLTKGTLACPHPHDNAQKTQGYREFVRAYAEHVGKSQNACLKTCWPIWREAPNDDKEAWYFIADLTKALYTHCDATKKRIRIPLPSGEKYAKSQGHDVQDPDVSESWGVLLTYHTNIGQEDPEAQLLAKESRSIDELVQGLKELPDYKESFEQFQSFVEDLGSHKQFPTWACCMELNTHARQGSKVHLHAFLGQDCSYFNFATFYRKVVLKLSDVIWQGIKPHVQIMRPMGKNGMQLSSAHGLYYVMAPKIGQLYQAGSKIPHEQFAVLPRTILGLWQARKLTSQNARTELIKTRARGIQGACDLIQYVDNEVSMDAHQEELQSLRSKLRGAMVRFIEHRQVNAWKLQYQPSLRGSQHRYKLLLLRGPSRAGKSMYARHLFGDENTLLINFQGLSDTLPDLRHFKRNKHKAIILDEANPLQVLSNKALLQAQIEPVQMAQSQCGVFRYFLWVYGVAFILCSNKFSLEPNGAKVTEEDSEWLKANIEVAELKPGEKWYIESKPVVHASCNVPSKGVKRPLK